MLINKCVCLSVTYEREVTKDPNVNLFKSCAVLLCVTLSFRFATISDFRVKSQYNITGIHAKVKGMSERSKLTPCTVYHYAFFAMKKSVRYVTKKDYSVLLFQLDRNLASDVLIRCRILAPLQLMGWSSDQASSAIADLSVWHLAQASLYSLSLVPRRLLVSPM